MSEMVNRVARVIRLRAVGADEPAQGGVWLVEQYFSEDDFRDIARAAIEVIDETWREMIDAALQK